MLRCIVLFYWLHIETGLSELFPPDHVTRHVLYEGVVCCLVEMLSVQDVSYGSEGFYSCVAGNTLGETISSAYLEIAGRQTEHYPLSLNTK